jgi:hypothetical protein
MALGRDARLGLGLLKLAPQPPEPGGQLFERLGRAGWCRAWLTRRIQRTVAMIA